MNLNKTLYQIEWTPFSEYFVEKQSSSFPQSFDLSRPFCYTGRIDNNWGDTVI